MALAELIAPTTSAVTTAGQVVATKDTSIIALKKLDAATEIPQMANVNVQYQDSGSNYVTFKALTSGSPILTIPVKGTIRLVKDASSVAFGVDIDN